MSRFVYSRTAHDFFAHPTEELPALLASQVRLNTQTVVDQAAEHGGLQRHSLRVEIGFGAETSELGRLIVLATGRTKED